MASSPLIALRLLQHFSCSRLNPKADLALEEAGLTPGPAESTLLVGWLGDTQGACLRDESPVGGDEGRSLAGDPAETGQRARYRASGMRIFTQTSTPKPSTGITWLIISIFTVSPFSPHFCSAPHLLCSPCWAGCLLPPSI